MQNQEEIIDLNVGGSFYTTTMATLTSDKNSMLASMFSGRFELQKRHDGRVFIDRDGEMFKHILQYLRDGELDVDSLDQHTRKKLSREASYFCLNGMEDLLRDETSAQAANVTNKNRFVHLMLEYGYANHSRVKKIFPNLELPVTEADEQIEIILEEFYANGYSLLSHNIYQNTKHTFIFKLD